MHLKLESPDEARALLRALTAAKFAEQPYDMDVLTSRLVARIANELSQVVREEDEKQWGAIGRQNWATWYWLSPERREWEVALKHGASLCGAKWKDFSTERRTELVKLLVCPFGLTDEFQFRFMSELDGRCVRDKGSASKFPSP